MTRTIITLVGIAMLLSGCSGAGPEQGPRLNIVFILADDLGAGQLGCSGSTYYTTPNIDRMAEEGVRFSQAYAAAPVCSPTRAAILTGKLPARLHLTNYIPGRTSPGQLLRVPEWRKYLPLEELTVAEWFLQHGYQTAHFGKWHLSREKIPPASAEYGPGKQGFREHFTTYKPSANLPIGPWQVAEKDGHSVDTITARATDFMERNKNHPFLLFISHNTVHDPLMEHEERIEQFRQQPAADQPEHHPVLGAMIWRLDASVGRILETIDSLEIGDRTVVIFYSDNGGLEREALQTPFRHGKGWLYEGGIRVPLIIRWPDQAAPGLVCDVPVTSVDLFPTMAELAGIHDSLPGEMDGRSLVPLLSGANDGNLDERVLFWNFPHYHNGGPSAAIRKGDYKLIEWYEGTVAGSGIPYELYDLSTDQGEQENLFDLLPGAGAAMVEEMERMKAMTEAQEPTVAGEHIKDHIVE